MSTHRSWFPFILTGLSLALAVLIFAVYEPSEKTAATDGVPAEGRVISTGATSTEAPEVAPTGSEYEAAVRGIVSGYAGSNDAQAAWDTLIALWVPAEYKAVHVDLVIAFSKLAAGQTEDGAARLTAVKEANSWLAE